MERFRAAVENLKLMIVHGTQILNFILSSVFINPTPSLPSALQTQSQVQDPAA